MKRTVQLKNKKSSGAGMTVFAIAAAVLVVFCVVLLWVVRTSGSSGADRKALRIGEENYTVAQVNFFYFSALDELVQNADGYSNMLGLDTAKDLSKQPCPLSEDGESWKAYLIRQAEEGLTKVSVLCAEAAKNGMTLDTGAESEIDSELEYYRFLGQKAGYDDFAAYLVKTYGRGMSETILRGLLEKICLADRYEQSVRASFSFTEEQLQQFYREHEYLYSLYTYLMAYVDGSKDTDAISSLLASAQTAEAFENITLEQTGQACYHMTDVKGSELGDQSSGDVAWLTDSSRQTGDTYVGKTQTAAYVLYFVEHNDNGFREGTDDSWKSDATAALQDESYQDWLSAATGRYTVKEYRSINQAGIR
ncbi:MAG: hypothetical protein LLF75_03855 [Eubacteriales bacterium]|nr:hypothetical protein [Eubacteriales bacterium]